MLEKRRKFFKLLTLILLGVLVAIIICYNILSAFNVMDKYRRLDIILSFVIPCLIFFWTILYMKFLEYRFLFKQLKIVNQTNFGNAKSLFNDYSLFKKSLISLPKPKDGNEYYMIVFTPCNQDISSNFNRNEIVVKYNGLIAEYIESYFNTNNKLFRFNSSYSFYRNTFVLFVYGKKIKLNNIIDDFQRKLYEIAKDNEIRIFVEPFFGIAKHEYGEEIDLTFDKALLAKYRSEHNFETVTFYSPEMMDGSKLSDVEDILSGIKNNEFVVYYQPKYNLKTKTFTSSEALVRWNSSKYGFLSPSQFISKAEKAGLIHEIDMYVFNRVCEDLNDMYKRGKRIVPVSINFSLYEFYSPTFVADIVSTIKKNNLTSNLIEIEITEATSQSNPFVAISILKQLRSLGFRVLMDDFGCDFSNFNNLRRIPIDCLKIDKTFIDDIVDDVKTREIVKFLIELGKNTGMEVIAEGVDKAEQVNILKKTSLDGIQGYFYSKPISKDEYEKFLLSNSFEKKGAVRQ